MGLYFSITLHTQLLTNLALRKTRAMLACILRSPFIFFLFKKGKRERLNISILLECNNSNTCLEQHKKSLDDENI